MPTGAHGNIRLNLSNGVKDFTVVYTVTYPSNSFQSWYVETTDLIQYCSTPRTTSLLRTNSFYHSLIKERSFINPMLLHSLMVGDSGVWRRTDIYVRLPLTCAVSP